MDDFGATDLRELTTVQPQACVSIYLPTHVSGSQGDQQDEVRLKNLLRRAEDQLGEDWLRPVEAKRLLQAAGELPNDVTFWEHRSNGLAIFAARESCYRYRLPLTFDELVVVNRRFHVKPILPLFTDGGRFFLLTLSQNNVRLLEATRHQMEQRQVEGLPTNMKDGLNFTESDRGSQVHSATRGQLGKQAGVFHGQGGQQDTRKEDLAAFFRLVESALRPVLRDERAQLLLAGVQYLLPIYREINTYPNLAEQELLGNCDHLSKHVLHQRALDLMEPVFTKAREDASIRYRESVGSGKTSADIEQIVLAALDGRVDTLFVDRQGHQWGAADTVSRTINLHDSYQQGDDDLLDLAAVETLHHRGTVFSLPRDQVPDNKMIAALFRY